MKTRRMILLEIKKSFDNRTFKIIFLIEIIMTVIDFFLSAAGLFSIKLATGVALDIKGKANNCVPTVLMEWLPTNNGYKFYHFFLIVLPIIAAASYGISYYHDKNNGLINQLVIKSDKKSYYTSKLVALFVNGGTVAVIPVIVNLILCLLGLPWGLPMATTMRYNVMYFAVFSDMFYTNPLVYVVVYLLYTFILFGLINTVSMTVLFIADTSFMSLFASFMLYYGSYILLCSVFGLYSYSLYEAANMTIVKAECMPYIVLQMGILLLSALLNFIRVKKDVL